MGVARASLKYDNLLYWLVFPSSFGFGRLFWVHRSTKKKKRNVSFFATARVTSIDYLFIFFLLDFFSLLLRNNNGQFCEWKTSIKKFAFLIFFAAKAKPVGKNFETDFSQLLSRTTNILLCVSLFLSLTYLFEPVATTPTRNKANPHGFSPLKLIELAFFARKIIRISKRKSSLPKSFKFNSKRNNRLDLSQFRLFLPFKV